MMANAKKGSCSFFLHNFSLVIINLINQTSFASSLIFMSQVTFQLEIAKSLMSFYYVGTATKVKFEMMMN